jgi:hypothetical protein
MSSYWKIITILLVMNLVVIPGFAALQAADAPPEYSGAYSGHLVWSGTVTMSGDVLVLEGGTLTILAGTRVNVVPAQGTKIDPEYLSSQTELLVRGALDVQGTPVAPVRFVIMATSENEAIAWSGITLDNAAASRIHNAQLERADIAIRCVRSSPEIRGNRISRCRYGIVAQQQSHPEILANILRDGEGGIFCWRESNPYLLDNLIVDHDEEAVFIDAGSRPRLHRNTISGNAIGLALYHRDLSFDSVSLTDNVENVRWLGRQGQAGHR